MMARVGERLVIAESQTFQHQYTFRDAAGAAYDPTTVTCTILEPDGVQTTYTYGVGSTVVKSAAGIYYVRIAGAKDGQYVSRFVGTATGYSDADEVAVRVLPKKVS